MIGKKMKLVGEDKVVKNLGVKYSVLLEKFMSNFMSYFSADDSIEEVFEFFIAAWNFGNLSLVLKEEEFKSIMDSAPEQDLRAGLLPKLIEYKVANFKEYSNFIVEYELTETPGNSDPILSIITQEQEAYLTEMLDDFKNQVTSYDFTENYVDRQAIILTALQPFIDWHNNLYPDRTFEVDPRDANIYLVNEDIDNLEIWLRKKFDKLFVLELSDWHSNKKEWPQRRNYKMFEEWFQVKRCVQIYDLEYKPVLKSE